MTNSRPNPYVGPRSFEMNEKLYGRDRELRMLSAQLISERVVLLHSPSGAGKTSLIRAGLIPKLRDENFHILPIARVNLEPSSDVVLTPGFNRYVYSVIAALEDGLPPEQRRPLVNLASQTLDDYISERPRPVDAPRSDLLVFDQFEEILTSAPSDREGKLAFFAQLGTALRNPTRWALFAIREDYLGALAPYVRPVPNRFEATFRLDLLGVEPALQAILSPAKSAGVDFKDEAARKLVDDLRHIQVQQLDGSLEPMLGEYIEPVQLQVVCYRLWQTLADDDICIDLDDIASVGDVDQSLADYYALSVASAAEQIGLDERTLREWFENKLITKEGIRGQVLMGAEYCDGLDNRAVRLLENAHIIRAEKRARVTWFELAHDRLIKPVRKNNNAWFESNLKLFQKQAVLWDQQGRSEGLLLRGEDLLNAEIEAKTLSVTKNEKEFLLASVALRKRITFDRRRNQLVALLGIVVIIALFITVIYGVRARNAQAETSLSESNRLATIGILNQNSKLDLAFLLGVKAFQTQDTLEARSLLLNLLVDHPHITAFLHLGTPIYSVTFNPDGKLIASGDANGNISIWDVVTRKHVGPLLTGHSRAVTSVSFSPDGKTLVSASCGGFDFFNQCTTGEIFLWNSQTWKLIGKLTGHKGSVTSLAFNRDGKVLAAGGCSSFSDRSGVCKTGEIHLWDIESRQSLTVQFPDITGAVTTLAFSPNGTLLAWGGEDKSVHLWNIESRQLVGDPINGHSAAVRSLAFSPDGSVLASGGDDKIINLWDATTLLPLGSPLTGLTGAVVSIAFSPDGKILVSGSDDNTVLLWDVGTQKSIDNPLTGHNAGVTSVAFSSDKKTIVSAGKDGNLILWDASKFQPLGVPEDIQDLNGVATLAFSPDGKTLALGGCGGNDEKTNLCNHGVIFLWDSAKHVQIAGPLTGQADVITSVTFSPNGRILASASADNSVLLWDTSSHQPIGNPLVGHTAAVTSVVFSPDGKILASASADQTINLWDTSTHKVIGEPLVGHKDGVTSLAFSTDGKTLASGSNDKSIILWDVSTHKMIGNPLSNGIGTVTSIAFSPDGKILASGRDDKTILLWDVESRKPIGDPLTGHAGAIKNISFSPNGQILASASDDHTVILWDTAKRQPIGQPLRGHNNNVTSVAFNPRSQILVSGSCSAYDNETSKCPGEIYLWDINPTSWQLQACEIANRDLTFSEWDRYIISVPYGTKCNGSSISSLFLTPTPGPSIASPEIQIQPYSPRVLVVVFDPIVDAAGTRLTQKMLWSNPDDLINGYIADIEEASDGLVKYNVVDKVEVDGFPIFVDGFSYDVSSYLAALNDPSTAHPGDVTVDYIKLLSNFDILQRVANDEVDEVWVFGGPYFGLYESRMAGQGAFWCYASALETSGPRFVIMGFSYRRGVGEMLNSFGHRVESIMTQVYRSKSGKENLFERFTLYDKIAPGKANLGTLFFAPNSDQEYDWANPKLVPSAADDWLLFPNLPDPPIYRQMNANEWGNGDVRLHVMWWLQHLPKAAGTTDDISNNWWKYIANTNTVP